MSECMTQEDAMRMSCEQAIECLENLRMLLARKSGKIHTDYCFALDKAIDMFRDFTWIPVKTRPMNKEERQYWEEHYGYTFGEDFDGIMFDCPMPEDGEEVWVCSKCGNVWQDTCEEDEGIGLEGNGDWDDIVAWMPFNRPEPYKGE